MRKDSKKHRHARPVEGAEDSEAPAEKKEIKKVQPFLESNKKSFNITNDAIDYSNKIAYRGKKDKQKVLNELLDSRDGKTSRAQNFKNKVLKPQPTLNQMLKQKREKRKKLNMKKYTKIQIKKAKV
jgi:transketolase